MVRNNRGVLSMASAQHLGYESAQPGTQKQQFARVPPPHRMPEEIGGNRFRTALKVIGGLIVLALVLGYSAKQIANDKENTQKAEKQDGVLKVQPAKIK
jgi:hypothetical protein